MSAGLQVGAGPSGRPTQAAPASAWGMCHPPTRMKRRCLCLKWPLSCSTPGYVLWCLNQNMSLDVSCRFLHVSGQ